MINVFKFWLNSFSPFFDIKYFFKKKSVIIAVEILTIKIYIS